MTNPPDNKRPATIACVADYADNWDLFANALKNFLDEFYLSNDRSTKLSDEPALTGDKVMDAYLAATAESLADCFSLPIPSWASAPSRFLNYGWYPPGVGRRIMAILLFESPIWFRRRGLFVSKDALDRASTPEDKISIQATYQH